MGWGGFTPWGGAPGIPAGFQTATAPAIQGMLDDPHAEWEFVLEGIPYRQAETDSGFPSAWGAFPWGYGGDSNVEKLRYSWRGLTTSSSDTPADTYMPALLVTPLNFQLDIAPPGAGGSASGGFGTVEFAANDDDDINGYWAGRTFALKVGGTHDKGLPGETTLTFAQYSTLYRFRASDLEYDEDIARLAVRDQLQQLGKTLQTGIYAGTGTYEGDDQLKGQYKPRCYGQVFNAPAVMVDADDFIYQLHDGAVSDITDVRVNGLSLSDAGDTTDLPGWTGGSNGQYKTDISRGLVRLWQQPDGQVTADVTKSTTGAGQVLREIANDAGILGLDEGSFFGFATYTVGVYVGTSAVTVGDVMQQVAASLDSWVYANRQGQVALGEHGDPINELPVWTLEGRREDDAPCVVAEIRRQITPPSPYRVKVAYKRNWSPQSEDSLDSTLTETVKQSYARAYSATEYGTNAQALDVNPDAPELFLDAGYLVNEADAITVRDAILTRARAKRDLFSMTITAPLFQIIPGQVVKVFHDRFGLSAGRKGEVIGIVEAADVTTLQVLTVQ